MKNKLFKLFAIGALAVLFGSLILGWAHIIYLAGGGNA